MTIYYVVLGLAIAMATIYVIFSNGQTTFTSLLLKSLSSFFFVILAIVASYFSKTGFSIVSVLVVSALVSSCFGDVILAMPGMPELAKYKDKMVLCGGSFFAIAHVCYFIAMVILFDFSWWSLLLALVLAIAVSYLNEKIGKLDYGKLKMGIPFYFFFLSTVLSESLFGMATGHGSTESILFFVALLLFYASDVILMNIYFNEHNDPKKWYYSNLGTYYAAQIILASLLVIL